MALCSERCGPLRTLRSAVGVVLTADVTGRRMSELSVRVTARVGANGAVGAVGAADGTDRCGVRTVRSVRTVRVRCCRCGRYGGLHGSVWTAGRARVGADSAVCRADKKVPYSNIRKNSCLSVRGPLLN